MVELYTKSCLGHLYLSGLDICVAMVQVKVLLKEGSEEIGSYIAVSSFSAVRWL